MSVQLAEQTLSMNTPPISNACSTTIKIYQQIASITTQMCAAAIEKNWNHLLLLGQEYQDSVESLRNAPSALPESLEEREERTILLNQILENDAKVRDLAMPELGRMSELLTRIHKQKSMLQAYGQTTGSLLQ